MRLEGRSSVLTLEQGLYIWWRVDLLFARPGENSLNTPKGPCTSVLHLLSGGSKAGVQTPCFPLLVPRSSPGQRRAPLPKGALCERVSQSTRAHVAMCAFIRAELYNRIIRLCKKFTRAVAEAVSQDTIQTGRRQGRHYKVDVNYLKQCV